MKKVSKKTINEAVKILENGGIIVYPTETVYGIGCDATNAEAVKRVLKIKERPQNAVLSVIVSDIEMAKRCGKMGEIETKLAKKHWPGPLTIVLQDGAKDLSPLCIRETTSRVRVPDNKIAIELAEKLGQPIIATSANKHGKPPCYTVDCVKKQMKNSKYQPDMYIDAGKLPDRAVSMVIEVIGGEVVIHRQGSFKL